MKTKTAQMIYISCWRCGNRFGLLESEYTHGKVCGKC